MSRFGWTALLLAVVLMAGCARKAPTVAVALTIEDWKVLPAETKFEFQTLERLKAGTAKFQNDDEWDKFARTVVIPAQKKELPSGVASK